MAGKYVDLCNTSEYRLKHLFYALRTTLAANWIIKYRTFPPVSFSDLCTGLELEVDFQRKIDQLIKEKSFQPESYVKTADVSMQKFLKQKMEENAKYAATLRGHQAKMDELDFLFRKAIMQ